MTYVTLDQELLRAFKKREIEVKDYSVVSNDDGTFTWTIVGKHQRE